MNIYNIDYKNKNYKIIKFDYSYNLIFLQCFKKYIYKIFFYTSNNVYIYIDINYIFEITEIIKDSILFDINSLVDIAVIDWIWPEFRFHLFYNFYSYILNYRCFLIIEVPVYKKYVYGIGIWSLTALFNSASWLEREVWDCFGLYFYNHSDFRRILTDYGFKGNPFRKDFPLSGFYEIRYDDNLKLIISEPIKMYQNYRVFEFINPWVW